ncbi:MAG: sugar phosphate isomerase/epimerase [Acidobacteriota bacterium]|nr:sugar phosphate isomerase/epimerase [Acidobacteriota bacterium]
MNRRTFIGSSMATTVMASGAPWAPSRAADGRRKLERIGMQLYTVRDLMKADVDGTLAKVAAIGYNEVEFAGYFEHAPKDIRAMLDKHKLTAPSEHVSYEVVQNKWQETLDAAHIVGHKFIVCPSIDDSQRKKAEAWKKAAEVFNRAGEASKKAGIQFAYHNHTWEFEPLADGGGKFAYDILLSETDAQLVTMEMDLCWITIAGQDALKYFDKYPGRFPLVHVKDWTKGADGKLSEKDGKMADVGSGGIDWKRIFAESKKAGIEHYFVEHDEPASPLESLTNSYKYLQELRY